MNVFVTSKVGMESKNFTGTMILSEIISSRFELVRFSLSGGELKSVGSNFVYVAFKTLQV